jgi:hypothetical protein
MLFLQPPFHIIEGLATFGDHANKRQFYFLPVMPKLTTVRDPVSLVDVPQIQLLKFRGDAGTGGFLTFEVNLGVEEERLANVAAELKRRYQLRDDPFLAPVVVEDGNVRLIMLDRATAAPPVGGQPPAGPSPDGDGGGPRFVLKIDPPTASKPALYGDNQAIFSVQLTQDGVDLVEASLLQGEMLPIGVVYALDFFALRPAYTVQVTADWNRVQNHFEQSFGFDYLFSSVEIDTVVDKLIEDRVVVINVDTFLPEGEDAGSWVGRRDQAVNDFKDMVLDSFFEPSLEPVREEEDGWDRFIHTAERLTLLGATGGLAGSASFHFVRRDITRIDQKRLNLVMNERVTVKRSIYPQANLKALGRHLRDLIAQGAIERSRFIQEVTLNSPWFQRREVKANALVNFDYDSVDSVNLTLAYGGQPQTLRLTKADASGTRRWNSIVVNNAMRREVEYQYRVNFRDVDTSERPGVLESPKMIANGDEFEISPRAEQLYFVDEIKLGADQLPWNRFPSVSVEVRQQDAENGIRLAETFMLTQAQPEATWKRFRLDSERDEYQVRVTYLASDNRDIATDWRTTDQERLLIRDPRPAKRTVQVVPAVPWGLVAMVFVELGYDDAPNGVHEQTTLSFFNTDQDRGPKTFSANLVDPEQRLVSYSATILLSDNRVITIPPSMTVAPTIFIRTDMVGHRVVTVRPADVNFGTLGILRMEADLEFADETAGLSFADKFTFWSAKDSQVFEFDYASAERNRYRCRVRTVHANGLVQERDLGLLNGDRMILPAA